MLDNGELDQDARELAKQIFRNLGEAEAKVHGTSIQKVHFHEVGAIDSIADITGVAIALTELGIQRIESSPVPTGTGTIEIAHGKVGVPAPATAELLRGIPIAQCDIAAELTTPTGAAILKTTARKYGSLPSMRINSIGYGSGTMDLESQANLLRVLIGEDDQLMSLFPTDFDQVVVMESNIDDSTAEELSWCVDKLFEAGAIDVYQAPVVMKKGRAATQLTVLAPPETTSKIEAALFCHSGTIGVRRWKADRTKLLRISHAVETSFGQVEGKCVWLPLAKVGQAARWRFTAEHDSLRQIAETNGVPITEVRDAAREAFNPDVLPPPE